MLAERREVVGQQEWIVHQSANLARTVVLQHQLQDFRSNVTFSICVH
jgi:hypothetical protein